MSLFIMECICGGELFEEVNDPEEAWYSDSILICTTCGRTVRITHREEAI